MDAHVPQRPGLGWLAPVGLMLTDMMATESTESTETHGKR
jgi:hypothetical protein